MTRTAHSVNYRHLMKNRWVRSVLLWAVAHIACLVLLDNFIFLLSHLPNVINLDGVILFLTSVHQILKAPRRVLRWLWPGETTPWLINLLLPVANSLVWGAALAGLQRLKQRRR